MMSLASCLYCSSAPIFHSHVASEVLIEFLKNTKVHPHKLLILSALHEVLL